MGYFPCELAWGPVMITGPMMFLLVISTGTNFFKIQIWIFFLLKHQKKIIHAQIIHEYELSSSFQPTISVPVEMTSKNIMGPVIITGSHANSHGK